MEEATCEGMVTSTPGSNKVRCTPTTAAAVTSATFIIKEARAQPEIGRGPGVGLSFTAVGARAAGAAFAGFCVSRSGRESASVRGGAGESVASRSLRSGDEGTSAPEGGLARRHPTPDLGVRVEDAFALEGGQLFARFVVAEVDVVAEMLLAPFEHATLLIERDDGGFKTWNVAFVAVGPDVFERDITNACFSATGSGRAVRR
eukprot:6072401-Pleurochrysis_carterae.AAC.1